MATPIDVDIPHSLGKDEARRRIANNIGDLGTQIPGGAQVHHEWVGDRLNLTVAAMGQQIQGALDVDDSKVHVHLALPGMLGMFAGALKIGLQNKGGMLLEDHREG
jgi:putative polyhydroxyalkanoate system protein